jgi:tetratricopeptide (TPR) repeat protein
MRIEFGGQRGQSSDSVSSLLHGLAIALMVIYVLMAFTFRSYIQPVVIMSTLPLSLFGATLGHWLTGYDISLASLTGFVGLAGILVNDSLILVEFVNDSLHRGATLEEALVQSGKTRFRAICLTSITTFAGLLPILLEKSGQAKVMVPMAVTVSFGLVLATVFVLFLIPALLATVNDLRRPWFWLWNGRYPSPEEVEPAYRRGQRIQEEELAEEDGITLPQEAGGEVVSLAPPSPERTAPPASIPTQARVVKLYRKVDNVDSLVERANRRVERDDFTGALACYLAALLHEPDQAHLHFQTGLMRSRLDDWHGAAASFARAIELRPDDTDARDYRAWALLRSGQFQESTREFALRLEAGPREILTLKGLSTALLAMGRHDEAISHLSLALELAPRNVDLHFLRGNAHREKGAHRAAIADYDRGLEREPEHARALLGRGRSHFALREYESAIVDLDRALLAAPEMGEVLLHRGRAHLGGKNHRRALDDLTGYFALHPDHHRLHALLGMCHDALGDTEGAAAAYGVYLEHFPRSRRRRTLERYIRITGTQSIGG